MKGKRSILTQSGASFEREEIKPGDTPNNGV
jgi:hypothetical protein